MHDLGLRDYLQILSRRKWIVLLALVIVPLAAVAFSLNQTKVYRSSADVLIRYQTLPSTLSGVTDPNSSAYSTDPTRSANTQLQIAQLPVIADRVAAKLSRRGISRNDVRQTTVAPVGDTDLLRFTSKSASPTAAVIIATTYARQFTTYFQQLDTSSITDAITGLQTRIADLQSQGNTASNRAQIRALRSKVNQLQTFQSLQTSNAVLVRPAASATKIRPTPRKFGAIGVGLGLILGLGLALLRDAFDTRLRSAGHIGNLLKLPLLARVPPPPRKIEKKGQLVMAADPSGAGADAFRRLRMNLEFAAVGKPSQVVMVTSALPQEGKSTTLANLGLAMALAGRSVVLVDLDLHRPAFSKFFKIPPSHTGLSNVVLGHVDLGDALVSVPLEPLSRNARGAANETALSGSAGRVQSVATGSLQILPTGVLPPDPGEFVGLESVGRVVAALRERVDVVLIDAPPMLAVGDGLSIAGFADAIIVVARADRARRPIVNELSGTLSRLPATKLGFVVCGESGMDDRDYYYGYSYGYGYGRHSEQRQEEFHR